ncbi:chemotaxis protein [Malaciobacter halophilus]|uniref:Chemotaxis protein n=1 Tax=Malaciobacter halophilus TaxID=197482 RepID=A0A2N1J3I9_9BACT|nr:methyl-accepting chemotaxis protein [Malaciobacter halophilus]AXH09097.1 Cache sensor-containing MCP-domain signal transduction protein [Malaciobacter halophilus]PKI81106.1 chemotaxis protein [Malaciobacter halophilus]
MGKYSIKTKLLVLIFISVSLSFLVLGYQNATTSYESKYSLVKNKETNTASNISEYFDTYFESKVSIVKSIAQDLKKEKLTLENENIPKLLNLGKRSGNFGLLFIGFEENGYEVESSGKILTLAKDNFDARARPWYKDAVKKKSIGVTKPYWGKTLNTYVITLYEPIFKDGKIVAVLGADIALDTLINKVMTADITADGYVYIIDNDGEILIHKNKKLIGKESKFYKSIKNNEKGYLIKNDSGGEQHIFFNKINSVNWYSIIKVSEEGIFEQINKELKNTAVLFLILLIAILTILYLFLSRALAPLQDFQRGLYSFFSYLKKESNSIEKLNIKSNDEFGKMGKTIDEQMQIIEDSHKEEELLIQEVKQIVTTVKNGNLSCEVTKQTSNPSLNELKDILNDMIKTIRLDVNDDINQIKKVLESYSKLDFTNEISNPTGNIAIKINELCQIITKMLQTNKANGEILNEKSQLLLENVNKLNTSTNQTAVSLEESASAIEEVTNTVIANTQDIKTMQQYSNELSTAIHEGEALASSTVKAMDEINEETKLIVEAILVIDQIAFQTNILSLNAAVEAATAGESGKGFAVVAQEVRNLANRSAQAASEIKDLVEKATSKTHNGKVIADNMIEGYSKLSQNVEKTTHIISNISAASNEQKISIEQVNEMITKIDAQTQENSRVSSDTQEIAKTSSSIASEILKSANDKKFKE